MAAPSGGRGFADEARGVVNLIISGGIETASMRPGDRAGADGLDRTAAMIALNCNRPIYVEDYEKLGTVPGACHHCHTGLCPVGITTQDENLIARLPVPEAAERVEGFLNSMTQELQMFARACGKNAVHDLEPEDLRAMTIEASAITGIPLVGTNFSFRPESFAQAVADAMAQASTNGHKSPSGAH
jgi:glutamate synthase domain-containing protein 2